MPFRTPEEYLDSLRDGRRVFLDGDLVSDVTSDGRTRDGAQSAADECRRYHDPEIRDIFVTTDPETGDEADRFMVMPRSTEDLKARAQAIDYAQETGLGQLERLGRTGRRSSSTPRRSSSRSPAASMRRIGRRV